MNKFFEILQNKAEKFDNISKVIMPFYRRYGGKKLYQHI